MENIMSLYSMSNYWLVFDFVSFFGLIEITFLDFLPWVGNDKVSHEISLNAGDLYV